MTIEVTPVSRLHSRWARLADEPRFVIVMCLLVIAAHLVSYILTLLSGLLLEAIANWTSAATILSQAWMQFAGFPRAWVFIAIAVWCVWGTAPLTRRIANASGLLVLSGMLSVSVPFVQILIGYGIGYAGLTSPAPSTLALIFLNTISEFLPYLIGFRLIVTAFRQRLVHKQQLAPRPRLGIADLFLITSLVAIQCGFVRLFHINQGRFWGSSDTVGMSGQVLLSLLGVHGIAVCEAVFVLACTLALQRGSYWIWVGSALFRWLSLTFITFVILAFVLSNIFEVTDDLASFLLGYTIGFAMETVALTIAVAFFFRLLNRFGFTFAKASRADGDETPAPVHV